MSPSAMRRFVKRSSGHSAAPSFGNAPARGCTNRRRMVSFAGVTRTVFCKPLLPSRIFWMRSFMRNPRNDARLTAMALSPLLELLFCPEARRIELIGDVSLQARIHLGLRISRLDAGLHIDGEQIFERSRCPISAMAHGDIVLHLANRRLVVECRVAPDVAAHAALDAFKLRVVGQRTEEDVVQFPIGPQAVHDPPIGRVEAKLERVLIVIALYDREADALCVNEIDVA